MSSGAWTSCAITRRLTYWITNFVAILGKHVQQAGSLLHPTACGSISRIRMPSARSSSTPSSARSMPRSWPTNRSRAEQTTYRQAVADGAIALFTEKYGDEVRVIKIGPQGEEFSKELCGGTHVQPDRVRSACFTSSPRRVSGAGVRRIEAVTGRAAQELDPATPQPPRSGGFAASCAG